MAEPTQTLAPVENARAKTPSGGQRPLAMTTAKVTVGRFEIDLGRALSDFEHPYVEAFETFSHENGRNDHVALIVKDHFPVRQDVIIASMSGDFSNMPSLRFADTVFWPVDNRHRYVMVYRRPNGVPAIQHAVPRRDNFSEDYIKRSIIRPIFAALHSMAERKIFHGNIRPDNIFLVTHENTDATLGEAASSIPGINQPCIFETIDRGLADPAGKGVGTVHDDIYAFGATVAVLLHGSNPMEGKSDRNIIDEKLTRSSFNVLADGLRLSPGMAEFLRATLNDDPRQRWTIEQLASWVDGNRATPKVSTSGMRAQRAIDFNGKKYFRPRMLAHDLHENAKEAIELIDNGQVGKWIERALGDQDMANALNIAISRAGMGGHGAGYEERLLCFVSMALDPHGPIRFKNLKVFPSGLGFSMALAMVQNASVQIYGEFIRERYALTWLASKETLHNDSFEDLVRTIDHASKIIIRRGIDFGIERCLYELCPSSPCLSPLLSQHYVTSCDNLLKALEDIADSKKQTRPIDRHIASFISAYDNRDNSALFALFEGNDPIKQSLALLSLYQILQKRYDVQKLVKLCEWLMRDVEIVAGRFRNLPYRAIVIGQIAKVAKNGSLTKLVMLVDNPVEVKKDQSEFHLAGQYYYGLDREKESIRRQLNLDRGFGKGPGRQIAMFISVIMAAVIIVITLIMTFANGGS